jgi:hypothetical protein
MLSPFSVDKVNGDARELVRRSLTHISPSKPAPRSCSAKGVKWSIADIGIVENECVALPKAKFDY